MGIRIISMHFYSWELRRRVRHQAQKFTIDPELNAARLDEPDEICEMCGAYNVEILYMISPPPLYQI